MMGQMTLPDTRSMKSRRPHDLMADALEWIDKNVYGWTHLVHHARRDREAFGRVRVKAALEELRCDPYLARCSGHAVKLPNAFSAPFGRILAAWYPDLADYIPLGHSKTDGVSIPPCPDWAVDL